MKIKLVNTSLKFETYRQPVPVQRDITDSVGFSARGAYIDQNAVTTSSSHSLSDTFKLKANEKITITGKSASSSGGKYLIWVCPNSNNYTSADIGLTGFVHQGTLITTAGGTTSFTAESDCYIVLQTLTTSLTDYAQVLLDTFE